jgi:acid phosphatase type 7
LKPLSFVVAVALVRLAEAQGPILVRYPYLQNVGAERATILWATREPGISTLLYSTTGGATQTLAITARRLPEALTGLSFPYYQYQAELTGLRPDTEYSYRVVHEGLTVAADQSLRFRTAGRGPFSFLAFGDSGTGSPEQRALAQLLFRERPALVLHLGDLGYPTGTFPILSTRYLDVYQDLMKRVPFFATPGNHEYDADNGAPYFAIHAPPFEGVPLADRGRYYSFDWGEVHFTSLDTNLPLTQAAQGSGPMLQWLEQDLARTRQPWRVVFLQNPAYPTSVHETSAANALVRTRVVPILDRYNVQLVLSGDEHNYQESKPLRGGQVVEPGAGAVHVISGGGGAPLYPVVPRTFLAYAESAHHYLRVEVQSPRLTVHAIRLDGQEIDTFTLQLPAPPPPPPPPPPPNPVTVEGVVNAASFTPGLAPGSLISIFGRALAATENRALRFPLPDELSGTVVTLNGRRLPLLYVSSTQINANLAFDVEGPATLRVATPDGNAVTSIAIGETAPAIFLVDRIPAVSRTNGALVTAAAPAAAGEAVCLYLTGLGRPDGDLAAGQPSPVSPLILARGPIQVQIGDRSITPLFAGLAPGFTGLYQINFLVPPDLATGVYNLRVIARGATSNTVSLSVSYN